MTEKCYGWLNIYRCGEGVNECVGPYASRGAAMTNINTHRKHVATIKFDLDEWPLEYPSDNGDEK